MSSWKTTEDFSLLFWFFRLQCGHDDVVVEDFAQDRTLDASPSASMWPRRCRRGRRGPVHGTGHDLFASMWPRRCRRGRRSEGLPWKARASCFNVATTMSSWKTRKFGRIRPLILPLQCGHDDVVVEDWTPDGRLKPEYAASMWPRRCRRGRRSTRLRPGWRRISFNVATTMSSWKTWNIAADFVVNGKLQCGHDDVVVED